MKEKPMTARVTAREVYDLAEKIGQMVGRPPLELIRAAARMECSAEPEKVARRLRLGLLAWRAGNPPRWFWS